MTLTELEAWQRLAQIATDRSDAHLNQTLYNPGGPTNPLGQQAISGVTFDFSKQRIDAEVLDNLLKLADEAGVADLRAALFSGEAINLSEGRQVLHPALRDGAAGIDAEYSDAVAQARQRMLEIAESLRSGQWRGCTGKPMTDVVHIGIGGSHLGPELVVSALCNEQTSSINVHFAANVDSNDLLATLADLNPETTLFIVVSKSFTTLETRLNAESARTWFVERTNAAIGAHFIGVTSNLEAASAFGFDAANLLPMWDWVGGRYSLWSAVGLPILIALGEDKYTAFHEGARCVDEHFRHAPGTENLPLLSSLLATWNYNFLGAESHAILAYDERLRLLPEYLQQLEMESNGKSVDRHGEPVDYHTMPILWGGVGSKGQHAYHQLLHQGTRAYTADFIIVANDEYAIDEHHNWLLANALGQSQAMALGYTPESDADSHRRVAGNHPTTTIVLDELGPAQLGALLAVYEHKVFCQGAIWNINSFDQWGVELGKQLAQPIYEELAAQATHDTKSAQINRQNDDRKDTQDVATRALITHIQNRKR